MNPDIDLIFCHAAHLTVPIVSIHGGCKGMKPGQIMMMATQRRPGRARQHPQGLAAGRGRAAAYAQVYGLAMFTPMILARQGA